MNVNSIKLAISLVTYNGEKYLPFCLKSLAEQTYQDFTLLVIDNGSNDETVRYFSENYPQIKLVTHTHNIGFAKAHNQAIAWTNSEYVMLLNQDVILKPDYLEKAIGYLDAHSEAASVGGKIYVWDFANKEKTKRFDSTGLVVYRNHRVADYRQGEEDLGQADQIAEVFGLSGTLPIYRRLALNAVKINLNGQFSADEYLDEDFFSYKEDVDLAWRLRLAGFKTFYLPECVGYHDRSVSGSVVQTSQAIRESRRDRDRAIKIYSYKNHWLLLMKNEFFLNLLSCFFPIIWYEIRKFIFILLFERTTLKAIKLLRQQKKRLLQKRRYIIKNIRTTKARDLSYWYR